MQFSLSTQTPARQRVDCLVLPIYATRELSPAAAAVDKASRGQLSEWLANAPLEGGQGQPPLTFYGLRGLAATRVVLIGMGARDKLDVATFVKVMRKACDAVLASGAASAAVHLEGVTVPGADGVPALRLCVEAFAGQGYRFDECKSKDHRDPAPKLRRVLFTGAGDARRARAALAHGEAIAAGSATARTLGNRPPNVCTPAHLAEEARALGRAHAKLSVRVVEEAQMRRLAMGAFLAVARGSRQAPKLIVAQYAGGKRGTPPVVLVGKGVTFDTGGVSLKPAATMDEMKFDMCGAAAVLGTLDAVARLALPINVVGLVAATENMPDGNATRPGDVVTTLSGQTVEILNTDAEGRLILCDTLTYAARFKPECVVDVATLTGACVVALGGQAHGLWANDDALATDLLEAGTTAWDRAWRMPLWPEYEEALRSNFADVANVGGRDAGAVTAAMFLGRFTRKYRWAHLDIAGTAWKQGKAKGATGRPVPLLCQFLLARAGAT